MKFSDWNLEFFESDIAEVNRMLAQLGEKNIMPVEQILKNKFCIEHLDDETTCKIISNIMDYQWGKKL